MLRYEAPSWSMDSRRELHMAMGNIIGKMLKRTLRVAQRDRVAQRLARARRRGLGEKAEEPQPSFDKAGEMRGARTKLL